MVSPSVCRAGRQEAQQQSKTVVCRCGRKVAGVNVCRQVCAENLPVQVESHVQARATCNKVCVQ